MDLTELSDEDLDALRVAVLTEQEKRAVIASAPQQAEALNQRYVEAIGRQPGDEWVQPSGAHDAHSEGSTVTHGGKTWVSLIPANVWEPGGAGWREVTEEGGAPPEWVQPSGAHDAYNTGDLVTFQGAVYRSKIDGNTWSPEAYPAGWEEVTP